MIEAFSKFYTKRISGGFTADTALIQDNPKATTIYRMCVFTEDEEEEEASTIVKACKSFQLVVLLVMIGWFITGM